MATTNSDFLLPSLNGLHPASYQSSPLPDNSTHFRLATLHPHPDADADIHCDVATYPIGGAPAYSALSYACGDLYTRRTIFVGRENVKVYANLEIALRYLRKRVSPLLIWIDAICIRQSDAIEKSCQVKLMSSIYLHAGSVIGFIGRKDYDLHTALDTLQIFGQPANIERLNKLLSIRQKRRPNQRTTSLQKSAQFATTELLSSFGVLSTVADVTCITLHGSDHQRRESEIDLGDVVGADKMATIIKLLESPFFFRLWINQEILLSGKLVFMCGRRCYDGSPIIGSLLRMYNLDISVFVRDSTRSDKAEGWWVPVLNLLMDKTKRDTLVERGHSRLSPSLLQLILSFWHARCSDPRDRLYALMGLVSDGLKSRIEADYTLSPSEVMCRLTEVYINEKNDLSILSFTPQADTGSQWTLLPGSLFAPSIFKHFLLEKPWQSVWSAAGTSRPRVRRREGKQHGLVVLEVHGFVLDTVEAVCDTFTGTFDDPDSSELRDSKIRTQLIPGRFRDLNFPTIQEDGELDFWLTLAQGRTTTYTCPTADEWATFVATVRHWLSLRARGGMRRLPTPPTLMEALERIQDMRLFMTKDGRRGVGNQNLQTDDKLCVLFGGGLPFILRGAGANYRIVCDCYVPSIAKGEAMKELEAGKYWEMVFTLI